MNKQAALQLLNKPSSDDDLQSIMDWIVTRPASSKGVQEVLALLLVHPNFNLYMHQLGWWLEAAPWKGILKNISQINSIEVYEWILELAQNNPIHFDIAELWYELISNFRDKKTCELATKWIVKSNVDDMHTISVMSQLLQNYRTTSTVAVAKKVVDQLQNDPASLAILIEHTGDKKAVRYGLLLMKSPISKYEKQYLALSLMKIDPSKHLAVIKDFLHSLRDDKRYHMFAEPLAALAIDSAPEFAINYINEFPQEGRTTQFLWRTLVLRANQLFLNYAWQWFEKYGDNKNSLRILSQILQPRQGLRVPSGAAKYAEDWLQANRSHPLWLSIKMAILEHLSISNLNKIGDKLLSEAEEIHFMSFLIYLTRKTRSAKYYSMLLDSYSKPENDRHAAATSYWLFDLKPNQANIERLKSHYSDPLTMPMETLCQLVRAKDDSSLSAVIEFLKREPLHCKNREIHNHRGYYLAALLTVGISESFVHRQAENYLELAPREWEIHEFKELKDAYEKAAKTN